MTAAFAAGSLPVAAGLTGWAALTVLTSAAAVLLTASAVLGERTTAIVAVACGSGLALTAALWSLATPPSAIAELAALTASFGLSAARARHTGPVVVTTAGALAAATGLAWAAPLAVGWPPGDAAFAVLGVVVAAAAAATVLRRARPRQSVVLDLGAGLVALLSAAITGGQQDGFAFVAVTSAVIASSTAWLRTGHRRMTAAAAAAIAALAAVVAVRRPLGQALLAPAHVLANPWQGSAIATSRPPGLPLAIGVLALCLAALATAVGAWRGSGRASLDAVAVALPLVAAPAGLAMLNSGPGFLAMVGALLVMTLALTAWAALGESLAPAGAALVSATLTIGWALAAPLPTIVVFGCLTVGYGLCARRSRHAVVRIAAGSLTVLSAAALAEAAAFAAGLAAWEAALGALAIAAGAQIAAARFASDRDHGPSGEERTAERAASTRPALGLAIEVSGWMVAAAAVGQCLGRPWTAGVATAIAGITCLGVSARPGRRAALWAGLALCYAAWCTGLAAGGVSVPEAYTGPAALIALAAGWRASGREPRPHSWLAYGPGLALFLLPSLFAAWGSTSWIRPALAGLAAIAIAIAGARTRTQAPLLTGTVVALLDAGRELAPDVMRVVHALPGWIPVAVGGMVLLWAGATYEARLRNLTAIRRSLAAMS